MLIRRWSITIQSPNGHRRGKAIKIFFIVNKTILKIILEDGTILEHQEKMFLKSKGSSIPIDIQHKIQKVESSQYD